MGDYPYPVEVEVIWGTCQAKVLKNKLHIYFQSKKKSSGGDCEVECDDHTGRVIVRFKSEDVRTAVLAKGNHEITVEEVNVKLHLSSSVGKTAENTRDAIRGSSKPSGLSEDVASASHTGGLSEGAEETPKISTILLENVKENISEDILIMMLENFKVADFSLEMIDGMNLAAVSFNNTKGGGRFLSECRNNNRFLQYGLRARPLEQPRSVRVENLPSQASMELLELYFENERVGGGKVEAIKMIPEESAAIVSFQDPKVTEVVLQRKHLVCKVPVNVYPYYESIGTALYGKDREKFKMPDPFIENIHPVVLKFLHGSKQITAINDQMKDQFCEVDFERASVKLCPLPAFSKQKGLSFKQIHNWKKNATDKFHDIMSKYKSFECDVTLSVWKVAEREIRLAVKQNVLVMPDLTKGVVAFAGLAEDLGSLKWTVEEILCRINKQIEGENTRFSMEVNLSPSMFYILQKDWLKQKTTSSYPELNIAYNSNAKKLVISGVFTEVLTLKTKILESQLCMRQKMLDVNSCLLGFLSFADCEEMSSYLFTSHGISAVYRIEEGRVVVTGSSDKVLSAAEKQLKDKLSFQTITVEDKEVLKRPEWQMLNKKLKESYNSTKMIKVWIELIAQNTLGVSGFCDVVSKVCESLSDYVNNFTHVKLAVPVKSHAVLKFIQDIMTQDWQTSVNDKEVDVVFESKKPSIQLSGPRVFIQGLKSLFKEMVASLHYDYLKIVKPGAKKYFTEKKTHISSMLMQEHNCVVLLQENNLLREEEDFKENELFTNINVKISEGLFVTVVKANLCQFQADAIVNAANKDLKHSGGLAAALLNAAGPRLQDVCNQYTNIHGPLKPGDAVITEAGRLPCKYVIHAVGPRFWDSDAKTAVQLLKRAVRRCLTLAAENNCHSVAIPAISSGIFGFPLQLCAETIAGALREHCESQELIRSTLHKIFLVDCAEKNVQALSTSVKLVFADHEQLRSPRSTPEHHSDWRDGASQSTPDLRDGASQSTPDLRDGASQSPPGLRDGASWTTSERRREWSPAPEQVFHPPGALEMKQTKEGLKFSLFRGNIQDVSTSVIVNTISEDLDLSSGGVSNALLMAAGPRLQYEVKKEAEKARMEHGAVVITGGCGLKCGNVFHTVCPPWDNGKGVAEKLLISIIEQCLKQAEIRMAESVCFPAIGTGNLGFPKDLVAKLMLSQVQEFSHKRAPEYLKEVFFVLHPSDTETFDCFSREFRGQTLEHRGQDKQYGGPSKKPKHPGERSQLKHRGGDPTQRGTGSIFTRFYGLVTSPTLGVHSMCVGHMTIEVSSGDITKQKTDAIVNSSNSTFTLRTGVSKAILEAAGTAVERECEFLSSQPHKGMIITQSGKMACKSIIHIVGSHNPKLIKEAVYEVLLMCEECKFDSIAFPALGTGAGGVNPSLVAEAMIDSVADFVKTTMKKNQQYLRLVKILVFQADMVAEFHKSMKSKEGTDYEEKNVLHKIKDAVINFFTGESASPTVGEDFTMVGDEFAPTIFQLCGKSRQDVCRAKSCLEDLIVKEQMQKTIRESWIGYFSQEDRDKLMGLQKELTVSIQMEIRGSDSLIRLEGLTRDVLTVDGHVRKRIREVERLYHEATGTAGLVEWQHQSGGSYTPFDILANNTLEQAFKSYQARVMVVLNGLEYEVDVPRREATHSARTIKLRRSEIKDNYPDYWDDMLGAPLLRVTLVPTSQEYKNVELEFNKTSANFTILRIERIQSGTLWKNYQLKKKSMKDKNRNSINEKQLFHGACVRTVSQINKHGFNHDPTGNNANAYGDGIYFAVHSSYAAQDTRSKPDEDGQKCMYLAKVLVGEFTHGKSGMLVPPAKSSDPTSLFDSVVDDPANVAIFVIFYEAQAYPEYLITFC